MHLLAALLIPALPAWAEPAALLRIEAALAAPGMAPGVAATRSDIISVERLMGPDPALVVELHPRHDAALADLTRNRAGQRLVITVCGRFVLEPLLMTNLPMASIVITADDPVLDDVEAALRALSCEWAAIDGAVIG